MSEEDRFDAADAYVGGQLLALLILAGQLIALRSTSMESLVLPRWMRLLLAAASAVAFGYLLATRAHPRLRAVQVICGLLLVPYFAIVPWSALRWLDLGRPWEAFVVAHVAMVSVAIVVPRSFRLSIAGLLVFFVEAIAIYVYFVRIGVPRASLPSNEIMSIVSFVLVGIFIAVVRRQRRRLVSRYLKAEAEMATLERLSPFLRDVVDEMGQALTVLSRALAGLGESDRSVERARKAAERLAATRLQLETLNQPSAAASQPGSAASEQLFHARDAQQSALWFALIFLVGTPIFVSTALSHSWSTLVALWALPGLVAALAIWQLRRTRERPSELRGTVAFLLVLLPWFGILAIAQPVLVHEGKAFEPFLAIKGLLPMVPLLAPRRLWLGLLLTLCLVVEGFVLYHAYHFNRLGDRIPSGEPWTLLLYLLIGIALLAMRDQRRVMSLRLLRAERQAATLWRQAQVSLALLDQVGSPLQVLALTTAALERSNATDADVRAMSQAVERIQQACARIPHADLRAPAHPLSFDGARLLTPGET
jgi:hypothetical protein